MTKQAYISINRQVIARNARNGTSDPAINIRIGKGGKPQYVMGLKIDGPCELLYDPRKPILKCGARLVIIADPASLSSVIAEKLP